MSDGNGAHERADAGPPRSATNGSSGLDGGAHRLTALSRAALRGQEHHPVRVGRASAPFDVVFLDRDGTLNALAPGYRTVADFTMLPGAADAVARLNASGAAVVLVTNQQGLGTGKLSWEALDAVHAHLVETLARHGAHLDDLRLCPHVAHTCECRKPSPGLFESFFADNPWVRRSRCVFVGDAASDEEAARAAGVPFVLVRPDEGLAAFTGATMSTYPSTCRIIPARS